MADFPITVLARPPGPTAGGRIVDFLLSNIGDQIRRRRWLGTGDFRAAGEV